MWLHVAIALFVVAATTMALSSAAVYAQASEPTAIIDAALRDLSGKIGKTLTRGNVDTYTWEQVDFPDTSLDCPKPGVMYAQVITRGYKILITVQGTVYDYRATSDGKNLFQCTGPAAATGAPTTAPQPTAPGGLPVVYTNSLAYIGTDGNVTVTGIGVSVGASITGDAKGGPNNSYPYYQPQHIYRQLRWSPDGSKLAFIDYLSGALYIARSGQKPTLAASGLEIEYPPAWSLDGNEVAYVVSTKQPSPNVPNGLVMQIQAVPANGGQPRVAGELVEGMGCGGGGIDPAQAAYFDEAGDYGNRLSLVQLSNGFLYSSTCFGIGLGVTTLNGQGAWLRPDLSRAALSPDRTRLVALRRDPKSVVSPVQALEMVDLNTGKGTPLPTPPNVDQVAWSADGTMLIYSTVTPKATIRANGQNPAGAQLFPEFPFDAQSYTVSLWKIPASGGDSTQLFTGEGRGIGLIVPTPDNSSVLFSFVNSLAAMFQTLDAGKSGAEALAVAPRPEIRSVPLNGGAAVRIVSGGQPTLAAGSFTAVPALIVQSAPTGVPPVSGNLPPPNLTIGGQAVVSVTSGSLNMRQTPGVTTPVKRLLTPGTVVTILAGPQIVDGLRWWNVRAPDNSTGWVADQVTDSSGTTNTLTPQ